MCTKFILFTRLYRYARLTKHKRLQGKLDVYISGNRTFATKRILQLPLWQKAHILICNPLERQVLCDNNLHTVHTAHGPTPHNHSQHNQCRTPYAVLHSLVLLKMGIMMPETCWDRCLIINTRLVASCWFLSLHTTFMMHGHKRLKLYYVPCITMPKVHY